MLAPFCTRTCPAIPRRSPPIFPLMFTSPAMTRTSSPTSPLTLRLLANALISPVTEPATLLFDPLNTKKSPSSVPSMSEPLPKK